MRIPRLTIILLLVLVGLVWAYLAFKDYQRKHFEMAVPAVFELTDAALIKEELSCGLAVFKVSKSTVESIQKSGLKFFDDASNGGGYPKPMEPLSLSDREKLSQYYYHTYDTWQQTPVPKSWNSEGTWIHCFYDDQMVRKITAAGKTGDAYYTSNRGGRAKLVVVPHLGLLAYSYFD